jgi:hypothetical protein
MHVVILRLTQTKFGDFATCDFQYVGLAAMQGESCQIYFNIRMILGLCPHYLKFNIHLYFELQL